MPASYHLGFYRTANRPSAIRSADPENHNLEPNMEWIGCTVSEIAAYWSEIAALLVFGAPVGGEAPDFRKDPW